MSSILLPLTERALKIHCPGLYGFTSPMGNRVLVLRLEADERNTPEVINLKRRGYIQKDWRREMEGDWSSPAGKPYFPIFSEIGRERYVHMAIELIGADRGGMPIVFRSYDFGRRHPACTWFQYSKKSDRIWLMREFMPEDLVTHEFRDCVRYLSNQVPLERLNDRSQAWIHRYTARVSGAHCPPPWFPPNTRFVDIGGKELVQGGASAVDPELATARAIFAEGDIHLLWVNPKVEGRNRVVDRMLMIRSDGWPGTFMDPQCEEMITGFEGAFSYPAESAANPIPTKPKDDGYFINLLDAYGYGVAAVIPSDTPKPDAPPRLVGYINGREPVYSNDTEEVGWYETRFSGR